MLFRVANPRGRVGERTGAHARLVAQRDSYLCTNRWTQRFLATQLVFMSVTLSPMFYAIYAAELGAGFGDMDDFLVFFGIGLLAGIPLWRLVRTRLGVRGMYACSAGISVAAAIICIVSQRWHLLPGLWALGPVLLLSALANQAVWPGPLTTGSSVTPAPSRQWW